jgi:hypothetical protein
MTKSEAAAILVAFMNTKARQRGITQMTRPVAEELHTEALSAPEGSRLQVAAMALPSWQTLRREARKHQA